MLAPNGKYLKSLFNGTQALGNKAISSDAYFEIKGFESIGLLIKQFPWPTLSPGGEIEVPMPIGAAHWQPQQVKVHQQGQITLMETEKGHIQDFMESVLAQGAIFDATVYEGTPGDFSRKQDIYRSFIQLDNPDRDWENRSQILLVTGTLFFHYFGSKKQQ